METILNPFAALDSRLQSIESTLALLAARELPQAEKRYYTVEEASAKLHVSPITIYRGCQAQKISHKRVGSRLMIPSSYVDNI